MLDTLTRYITGLANVSDANALFRPMLTIIDRYSTQPLTSAGLVISAGGATTAKTGASDFYAAVQGKLVKITAATAMPALIGANFTIGQFLVVCFCVDGVGVVTMLPGTPGATLAAAAFPQPPVGKALIGFLIITYAGAFTGGTTPLDTATTVYISPLGPFDATALV